MGVVNMKAELEVKNEVKNKNKNKKTLSEQKMAYLMIAPSIIIIIIVALYPVLRSFWYSLFDLRLNHPTKNSTYLDYKIDLERYFNNYDLVSGALKRAVSETTGETKDKVMEANKKFLDISNTILSEKEVASREKEVREIVFKFQPVEDDKLKFAKISRSTAENAIQTYSDIMNSLSSLTIEGDGKRDIEKAAGLSEELRDSIIKPNFVGFDNYKYYAKDKSFWSSLGYTLYFTFISVAIELILGIFVAMIMNKTFKGRGIVRAAVLIPWAIPTVVSAKMWKFLLDGQFGIVAHLLQKFHLINDAGWLLSTHSGATFSIISADVWKTTPYMALMLLAGLQGIDTTLYEASGVDGATKPQQFFKITLPLLKPTILVSLLFRTLDAFRMFDLVFVLTGGGKSTETISTYAYKTMFAQMEFGRGSTLSVIVFICVALISIGYIKILDTDIMEKR